MEEINNKIFINDNQIKRANILPFYKHEISNTAIVVDNGLFPPKEYKSNTIIVDKIYIAKKSKTIFHALRKEYCYYPITDKKFTCVNILDLLFFCLLKNL